MSDSDNGKRAGQLTGKLTILLAVAHADMLILLGDMLNTELTTKQREILAVARKKLRTSQTAFYELTMSQGEKN